MMYSLFFFPLLSVLKNSFGDWDKSLQGNGPQCKPRFWTVFAAGICAGVVASSAVTPVYLLSLTNS
jgi:hypothetical protein